MASNDIRTYGFDEEGIRTLGSEQTEVNWPVVYQIYDESNIYIGETTSLKSRMLQHMRSTDKNSLTKFSAVFDESFNKSVVLDLESQLIQWFSGDGKYTMLNKNDGLVDHDYYHRQKYRSKFELLWEKLRELKVARNSVQEIENSGLFKFSPYKQLNQDQLKIVYEILVDLDEALLQGQKTASIIGGDEGTGKTIVLMYLIKIIRDIQDHEIGSDDYENGEQTFDLFFKNPFNKRFKHKTIAMVVPSQALRGSIAKVFKSVKNLSENIELLSPIEFGSNGKTYDITFVDEAHLLKISNQEVHKINRERVSTINKNLFADNLDHTELEWIVAKSRHVVMVYGDQRIRPNNIIKPDQNNNYFKDYILKSQIRSNGGELYIDYLKSILSDSPPPKRLTFSNFEFKLYDDFKTFLTEVRLKEIEVGLSRVVAGFAWEWKSRKDKNVNDIVIDGIGLKWNSVLIDFVGSAKSREEVGSIYTIQGYDLQYCGVIIGNDLKYDPVSRKLIFSRQDYFDRGAKKRNKLQLDTNTVLTDEELLSQVLRTYRILMNRSIKGTYVYVCDKNLREYLAQYIDTDNENKKLAL